MGFLNQVLEQLAREIVSGEISDGDVVAIDAAAMSNVLLIRRQE